MLERVHLGFNAAAIGQITLHATGVLVASFTAGPVGRIVRAIVKVLVDAARFLARLFVVSPLEIATVIEPVRGPPGGRNA